MLRHERHELSRDAFDPHRPEVVGDVSVVAVRSVRYAVALREPFVTHLRHVTELTGVLVAVYDGDGRVGVGEAVPTPQITGETIDSLEAAVRGPLATSVLGLPVEEIDALCLRLSGAMVGNTSAKAALDIALHDLWARALGAPLHHVLGGARSELVTDVTVSLGAPSVMADAALSRVGEGFTRLKVKLGGPPAIDLARLRQIRDRVGAGASLRVDANQAWTPKEAIGLLRAAEDSGLDLELVEQPVAASDLDGLARVTAAVSTPVMADESCFSAHDLVELVRRNAVDAVNVKLMKSGGIRAASAILGVAEAAGIACSVGSMLESTVSVTAAACLAAGRASVTTVDLDAPLWVDDHPLAGGARWAGEQILLGDLPGLGIDLSHGLPDAS